MYQIIIVDDKTKVQNGLANLFPWNRLGFEITGPLSNGRDAYDFALSSPIDLILSDIRMPLMDELGLSERLLSRKKIKITFFNGYQNFDYVRGALRNGVFDYLLKPVEYEGLADYLTRVKGLLDSGQNRDIPKVCGSPSYYGKIISMVKDCLDTSYQGTTLEQAARLVSLNPNYLSKIMKEHSDTSFSDYLLRTRMEDAARMLRDIGYKQYGIAYWVDYDNPKNFSQAFHQYFSMTPTQCRNCGGRPEPQP